MQTDLTKSTVPLDVKPVHQCVCSLCGGTGWRETYIDVTGLGHGWTCAFCSGTGHIWMEVDDER
jgi:DnaJ-class molecular chaperone